MAVVAVVAITVAVTLVATARRDGPSDAVERGLRLRQPGSPASGGVPLHVAKVASRVERVRGLRFKSPPRVRVMSVARLAALGQRLSQSLTRRMSGHPALIERTRRLERARTGFGDLAGILPEQASDATAHGPAERIGGAYDYSRKQIILVQGAIQTRRELQLVLAHELTHALEDQQFALRLAASVGSTQRAQARRALIEGTAMFVDALYARRYLGDRVAVKQRLAGQRSIYAAGGSIPYAIKAATIFDYVEGAMFVRALYLRADGWSSVNRALRDPPIRTEEVLHPRAWRRSPAPQPVRLDLHPVLGAEWRLVGRGPAGEQDALAVLGEGAPEAEAEPGAAGWAGGRFELWRARGHATDCEGCAAGDVGVVGFRWRGRADTWQFARAYFTYMLVGRLGERVAPRTWRVSDEYASLRSARRASAIAFAPTQHLATTVAQSAALHAAGR
jgi:hypothetical protein